MFVWPLFDPPTLIDERNTDAMHTQFAWVTSQPLFFQLKSNIIIGVAMTTKPDFYYVFRNVLTSKRQANHPLFWSKHGWSFTILWSSDTSYLCWRYLSKKSYPYKYTHMCIISYKDRVWRKIKIKLVWSQLISKSINGWISPVTTQTVNKH